MEKSCLLLHRPCSINVGMRLCFSKFCKEKCIKKQRCSFIAVSASKNFSDSHQKVFDRIIEIVNFITAGALISRLFKKLCVDLDSDHLLLLYHAHTMFLNQWLSKKNVTRRFLELKKELKEFYQLKNQKPSCFPRPL